MTDPAPTPRYSWLRPALIASLAANLFLVGLVGGKVFSKPEETSKRSGFARGYSLHPRVMMEALPEARHADIRAYYAEVRQGGGRPWREIREFRREMDAALRADPFDPDALRAAKKREIEARATLRNKQNDDVVTFLETLTHEERVMIADLALSRMEERAERRRERREQRRKREAAEKKTQE